MDSTTDFNNISKYPRILEFVNRVIIAISNHELDRITLNEFIKFVLKCPDSIIKDKCITTALCEEVISLNFPSEQIYIDFFDGTEIEIAYFGNVHNTTTNNISDNYIGSLNQIQRPEIISFEQFLTIMN